MLRHCSQYPPQLHIRQATHFIIINKVSKIYLNNNGDEEILHDFEDEYSSDIGQFEDNFDQVTFDNLVYGKGNIHSDAHSLYIYFTESCFMNKGFSYTVL